MTEEEFFCYDCFQGEFFMKRICIALLFLLLISVGSLIASPIYKSFTENGETVRELSKAAGTYRCTLTLLDTDSHPTRETYQNYNFLTVLPFTVIVHEKAGREEDAV